MNAIFFGLKRAFHGTLRITRSQLAAMGLTAARFDMLFAVLHDERGRRKLQIPLYQSGLRRALGVSRPTVSRMLAALEGLGLVSRTRCRFDRRQLEVELTTMGRTLIRRAHRRFTRSGWAQLAVDSALGADLDLGNRWHDKTHCFYEMANFNMFIDKIREAYGDRATLEYRWRPDD